MIRLRYNGKPDANFACYRENIRAGELILLVSLDEHINQPATVNILRNRRLEERAYMKDFRYSADLNCFDYVPAIVPTNIIQLTEEELESWKTKAHQSYLRSVEAQNVFQTTGRV